MMVHVIGKRLAYGVDKKTGKKINNSVIHFVYDDDRVEGKAVDTKWIGAYCCSPNRIIVGNRYELEEFNNYVVKLEPIEEGLMEKGSIS